MTDDFSLETLEIRKHLLQSAKELELRSQGKGAKVVKDRLITWDREKQHVEQYSHPDQQ